MFFSAMERTVFSGAEQTDEEIIGFTNGFFRKKGIMFSEKFSKIVLSLCLSA